MNNQTTTNESADTGKFWRVCIPILFVPVLGALIYLVLCTLASYKSKRRILIVLLINNVAFSLYVIYSVYNVISVMDYNTRYSSTKYNLRELSYAIYNYKELTGISPSSDLHELYSVFLHKNDKYKTLLKAIPREYITGDKDDNKTQVYTRLGNEGGWYYNPNTGDIRVNYNKPLSSEWVTHEGEIPSDWIFDDSPE